MDELIHAATIPVSMNLSFDLGDVVQIGTIAVALTTWFFRYGGEMTKLKLSVTKNEKDIEAIRNNQSDLRKYLDGKLDENKRIIESDMKDMVKSLHELKEQVVNRSAVFETTVSMLGKIVDRHESILDNLSGKG